MPSRLRSAAISFAESRAMGVRQDASNSRMVALSKRPARCRSDAVSWIASDSRLRSFLGLVFFRVMMVDLRYAVCVQEPGELAVGQAHEMPRESFQLGELSGIDVVPLTLGKAVEEDASPVCLIGD